MAWFRRTWSLFMPLTFSQRAIYSSAAKRYVFFSTTTSPKSYTYAWLKLCLWMCDGRIRGSAVRDCDSENVAFCREFKVRESETEQRRASLQLSGCWVASWRFSVKTNNRKKQHKWKYWACMRLLLFMPAATSSLHKAPVRILLFIFSIFYFFFAVLILHSFSAVSPGL